MLLWLLIAIGIAGSLIANFTIIGFVGAYGGQVELYPPWVVELHLNFYWFSYLFMAFNRKFFHVTTQKDYSFLKPVFQYSYSLNLIASFMLRFAFNQSILVSYIATFVVLMWIPILLTILYRPYWEKRQESARIDEKQLKSIALQHEMAYRFTELYPDYKCFVIDYAVKNEVATCLFLHRRNRDDLPGLQEDVILEIPIDIKKKIPLKGREQIQRYIFRQGEGASAVMPLPMEDPFNTEEIVKPLDQYILDQFDTIFNRFPSLEITPLPIASRNTLYQEV